MPFSFNKTSIQVLVDFASVILGACKCLKIMRIIVDRSAGVFAQRRFKAAQRGSEAYRWHGSEG